MNSGKIIKKPLKSDFIRNILEEKMIADRNDCIFASICMLVLSALICVAVYFVGIYSVKLPEEKVMKGIYVICGLTVAYILYRVCRVVMEHDSLSNEDYYIVEDTVVKISANKRMKLWYLTDLFHIKMFKRTEDSYYFKKHRRISSERVYVGAGTIEYSNPGDVFYLVIFNDARVVGAIFNTKMYITEDLY